MACEHCGEVVVALEKWPQYVHDNCECLCHRWKSTKGKKELAEEKSTRRKKKK